MDGVGRSFGEDIIRVGEVWGWLWIGCSLRVDEAYGLILI